MSWRGAVIDDEDNMVYGGYDIVDSFQSRSFVHLLSLVRTACVFNSVFCFSAVLFCLYQITMAVYCAGFVFTVRVRSRIKFKIATM